MLHKYVKQKQDMPQQSGRLYCEFSTKSITVNAYCNVTLTIYSLHLVKK